MHEHSDLIAALDECADHLERLNREYPHLASRWSEQSVDDWRNRKSELLLNYTLEQKDRSTESDLGRLATKLLEENSLEDVQEIMREQHGEELSIQQLVRVVGRGTYLHNLKHEVLFMRENSISFAQIASLWNELERPAFGGDRWDAESVAMLNG